MEGHRKGWGGGGEGGNGKRERKRGREGDRRHLMVIGYK